ncbi:MAG: hypothetical protein HOC70_02690 [Gammaproteobacteria bacterium]|jgi:hypothetical protein|nr:hypothetical protein [Gammaproteobacteria bacterium]MBT7371031.1 hypothetical protein [Gammaproteobacteria bacterium]
MLTKADEYPFHQIAGSFSRVHTSDKHWNDGHYVCLCDDSGEVCLISVVRLYQNNDVLDGFVSLRHKGKQYNFRASRRLRTDIDFFGVGPLRIELLDPMQTLRLVLEENDIGITCDLVCESTIEPYEDEVLITRRDDILFGERAVYELVGTCEGTVSVNGEEIKLTHDHSTVFRNHSWGTMPGRGGPREHGAPPKDPDPWSGLRNWVLFRMPEYAGFYQFQENKIGERLSTHTAMLMPEGQLDVLSISHDLKFYEGTSRISGGSFTLVDENKVERTYEIEDLGWVYCHGGGYFGGFDDTLGQGAWRGEYHEEGEVWDASHPVKIVTEEGKEEILWHAWAESFVRLTCGDQVGYAHFECVTMGEYEPYGLIGEKATMKTRGSI